MKKTFTVIALLVVCFSAIAQNTGKDRLDQLENMTVEEKKSTSKIAQKEFKLIDLDLLSHIGFGWNLMDAAQFQKGFTKGNTEFFFNAIELDVRPVSWMSIGLGVDIKWQHFAPLAGNFIFEQDANNDIVYQSGVSVMPGESSKLNCTAIVFPLTLNFNLGLLSLSAGAELAYYQGKDDTITNIYVDDNRKYTTTISDLGLGGTTSWNLFASLTFGLTGVYVRYYPQQPLIPTAPFNFTTVGIIFNLNSIY